jgi:hypothetical protein
MDQCHVLPVHTILNLCCDNLPVTVALKDWKEVDYTIDFSSYILLDLPIDARR